MRERPHGLASVVIQRAVDLLENRFSESLTIKTVSAAVRTTPARLNRMFQKETGVTLHEYLTRLRLERATHLLRANVKVESVAHNVGYRSKKNFYRQPTSGLTVFEHRFGSRVVAPRRLHSGRHRPPILAPRL